MVYFTDNGSNGNIYVDNNNADSNYYYDVKKSE